MNSRLTPGAKRPGWFSVLSGRLVQRVCPEAKKVCTHTGCHLRALCQCAQDDVVRSTRVENRFWIAILGTSALTLVLWLTAN